VSNTSGINCGAHYEPMAAEQKTFFHENFGMTLSGKVFSLFVYQFIFHT
jgi:hypothetical protein